MHSDAGTVDAYLAGLPEDRRPAVEAVRRVVLEHLPDGFEEVTQYGMISYVVPLENDLIAAYERSRAPARAASASARRAN